MVVIESSTGGTPLHAGATLPQGLNPQTNETPILTAWLSDAIARQFASVAELGTALTAAVNRANLIRDYQAMPRQAQTGVDATKEHALMQLAGQHLTTTDGYSWGALNHQAEWQEAKAANQIFEQAFYAYQFGRWQQGPGLYFANTNDAMRTVSWAKAEMATPNLMKVSLAGVPTLDLTSSAILQQIAQILANPSANPTETPNQSAQKLFLINLPVLMLYGSVARLGASAGVTLNTDIKTFLPKSTVQAMLHASTMPNVQATLQTTLSNWP